MMFTKARENIKLELDFYDRLLLIDILDEELKHRKWQDYQRLTGSKAAAKYRLARITKTLERLRELEVTQ